jgi:hypothetical protein
MKQWSEIRRRVLNKEISKRQACREYGVHWDTLRKIEGNVEPPAFRRSSPRAKPVLAAYLGNIQPILEADKSEPAKQRHTAKRIYERLGVEHSYAGGESTKRQAVRELRQTNGRGLCAALPSTR